MKLISCENFLLQTKTHTQSDISHICQQNLRSFNDQKTTISGT